MPSPRPTLASITNRREIVAWGLYDLANQSFQLLINTLLFSLFVQTVIVGDPERGKRIWSYMVAGGLVLVVILSPILGALADQRAWKRELLLATGAACAVLTMALSLLGAGQVWAAAALYVAAALACGLGENFLGSFLPEISTPANVGMVSAIGWTMSYAGALLLLGLTAVFAFALGRDSPEQTRPMFVLAGLWFLGWMTPAALFLRERAAPSGERGPIVRGALRRLAGSARETGRFRQLARFLGVFFVYSLGTQTVIYFLGLIGDGMGFGLGRLVLFALDVALCAGLASACTARFQDSLGHRRTVMLYLTIWVLSTLGLAATQGWGWPRWLFWVLSGGIGVALGGIGTSSRAMVGVFTPAPRAGEFFGLWGMTYKLAGVVGPVAFAAVSTAFTDKATGQVLGLMLLAGFFAAGLGLMLIVDEAEGSAAARAEHVGDAPGPPTLPA